MVETHPLILTPTARLARTMARAAAMTNRAQGLGAWQTPPILAFPAWIARLREHYFLQSDDPRTPITSDQAHELWKSVIDHDVFIGEPRVAELAARAWRRLHDYQLAMPGQWPDPMMSVDQLRFREWADKFVALCAQRRLIDEASWAAELPKQILDGSIQPPVTIELAGFDLPILPLQQAVLNACKEQGSTIRKRAKTIPKADSIQVLTANDGPRELIAAAHWARLKLESDPEQRLGIVVHDLQSRVEQAENALRQVMQPGAFQLETDPTPTWHISLGKSLNRWPLVADALLLLGLNPRRLNQQQLGRWLRCPFLTGWPAELQARAETRVWLARFAPFELTLFEFTRELSEQAPNMLDSISRWRKALKQAPARAHASDWIAHFQTELSALGFGHGRTLSRVEHQLLNRWQNLLESFSALDVVLDQPMSRSTALRLLNERAGQTIFREQNPGVPVEVLGLQEALGSDFDALWITSMSSDLWPPPAQREAFIPGKMQQSVPKSSSAGRMALAELEISSVLTCATEVVVSFCCTTDAESRLTPLLNEYAQQPFELSIGLNPVSAPIEMVKHDARAPALTEVEFGGGTSLFQKQSDCPFRSFAELRLQARPIPSARPGLDPGTRGNLAHQALETLWRELDHSQALHTSDDSELQQRIEQSVEEALNRQFSKYRLMLGQTGRRLEKQRLVQLIRNWLAIEKQRPEFSVMAREFGVEMEFGGVRINGTIDRIDRIGSDNDYRTLLIDYKTGSRASSTQWAPDARIKDVQLPAYALAVSPPPDAIAFARLRPAKLAFDGIARADFGPDDQPDNGIRILGRLNKRHALASIESWRQLLDRWQARLDELGQQFSSGHAVVDPREPDICRHCHLHAFCRIHERTVLADPARSGEAG